jgi:phosphocarrier protein FPr
VGDGPTQVLARDAIFLGRPPESMAEAIEYVGGKLVSRGIVGAGYIEGMKEREETTSTFLGNGVALPHGTYEKRHEIKGTAIVVAQYPSGIAWGDNTAHLVIGLAAAGDEHVHILSQLAEVLQDEALCQKLWETDDLDFVYETLTRRPDEGTTQEVTILNPAGLHARPASMIVEVAQGLDVDVTIAKDAKTANAKSIMSLLALGATTGDTVALTAIGDDAEEALSRIVAIMTSEDGS